MDHTEVHIPSDPAATSLYLSWRLGELSLPVGGSDEPSPSLTRHLQAEAKVLSAVHSALGNSAIFCKDES